MNGQERNSRSINTPKNQFLEKKPVLFNLYLKMPVQFKDDWKRFRKRCKNQGFEFEDVLGDLIVRYADGEFQYSPKQPEHQPGHQQENEPERK